MDEPNVGEPKVGQPEAEQPTSQPRKFRISRGAILSVIGIIFVVVLVTITIWKKPGNSFAVAMIVIGTFVTAFSGREEKNKIRFVTIALVGAVFIGLGIWLMIVGGKKESDGLRSSLDASTSELHQTRTELATAKLDSQERFQAVMVQLNSVKQGESQKITAAKLRFIQDDVDKWAADLAKNEPSYRSEINKLKSDLKRDKEKEETDRKNGETQRQSKLSGGSLPSFTFATGLCNQLIQAYAKKKNRDIKDKFQDMPDNIFKTEYTNEVKFAGNAIWKLHIKTEGEAPCWIMDFFDFKGNDSGTFLFCVYPDRNILSMGYNTELVAPDSLSPSTNIDLSSYDIPLRRAIQEVLQIQLPQTEE